MTIQVLHEQGLAGRAIARQLGVSEGTVRYHVGRAGVEDGRKGKSHRAESLREAIEAWKADEEREERPVNVRELYEHLVEAHDYVGSYKSVLRFVRHLWGCPPIRTYRRVETVPGAQAQSDWGEYPAVDVGAGPEALSCFVMTLSHSRMSAVVWSRRKDQVSWQRCHNGSFSRLGGIPAVNRIDNVKTGISRGAGAWGEINPSYRAYARSLRFHIEACPPRAPEAKGKVEAKVKLSRRLVPSTRRSFESLEALQRETDAQISRWAQRTTCAATGLSVAESWENEKGYLQPLQLLPEPFDVAVRRTVQRDCMVRFEGRQYALPFESVGRDVEVRGCAGKVQIFEGDRLLREYPRHSAERVLIDTSCYEGKKTSRVLPPSPLGRMGRRLQEIYELPVSQRPLDLYAALSEVAR